MTQTINDSLQVNGELHVMANGLFDFGATGSVNVATPLGNPGVIGLAPNGNRRDIRFSNDGIQLTVSGTAQTDGLPPDLIIYPDRVAIRTKVNANSNILLPNANHDVDGNLFFGGNTAAGQVGLRLFGGNVNNGQFLSGFIDVRAGTPTDGIIFRVDTDKGGTERMRICADGTIIVPGTLMIAGQDVAATISALQTAIAQLQAQINQLGNDISGLWSAVQRP